MASTDLPDGLIRGLRALEKLAVLAPVETGAFARASGIELVEAANLFEAFETHGYARRILGGACFVLTDLALEIVGPRDEGSAAVRSATVH